MVDELKFQLVNWDSCVIPFRREDWGLVVMIFNQALLGKWLWDFGVETNLFLLGDCYLYGLSHGWLVHTFCESDLRSESLEVYKQGMRTFSKYVKYEVGKGVSVKFWHDHWWGVEPFRDQYFESFQIARDKVATVANYLIV